MPATINFVPNVQSTIWTLATAFGLFIWQLSTILVVNAKTGGAGNFGLKQIINLATGILSWYLLGYAFSYGASLNTALRNKFIGNYVYALHRIREANHNTTSYGYAWFIQQFFYAMVCNSIVASVLGGRSSVLAHFLSTVYTVSFLYPVIAHFIWSCEGWLSAYRPYTEKPVGTVGAVDFAGSGVVHLLGASISLAASLFLRKKDSPKAASEDSVSLTLGSFLALFAMFSFVTGASISIEGSAIFALDQHDAGTNIGFTDDLVATAYHDANNEMHQAVGRGAVCLTLSVAVSALVVLFLESFISKEVNLTQAVNALTIGFASICSNIYTCEPWAACVCGAVAGFLYIGGRRGLKKLKDNDVFVMHGLGGIWGLLFTGFLAKPKFMRDILGQYFYPERLVGMGEIDFTKHAGVFYPADSAVGKLLACQILEAAVVFFWGFLMALPLFGVLAAIRKLTERSGEKYTEKNLA